MEDTIFAPLTIKGKCSIYVIRISGSRVDKCLSTLGVSKKFKHKSINLCNIKDENNNILDQALILYFKAPNSFTGEDVCELNIHCSTYIINKIFKILLSIEGVRLAKNGEFSKRAFLNNKLDLIQAESIVDLVNSETELQHKQAIEQLEGKNSRFFNDLRQDILDLSSSIEANIDFPEDETINVNINSVNNLISKIENILNDNDVAKKIKNGLNISIIGEPNVGKSSFLNYLAKKDLAIVSNIAGTTRDIIETSLDIDGVLVNVFDTAGIRDTNDTIEKEGVKRAIKNAEEADLRILILSPENINVNKEIEKLIDDNTVIILNKIDTLKDNSIIDNLKEKYKNIIEISVKNNINLDKVIDKIKDFINKNITPYSNTNITQERYRIELKKTIEYLKKIDNNMPIEIVAENIRLSAFCIGKIVGQIGTEEILDNIFSKFCIGK